MVNLQTLFCTFLSKDTMILIKQRHLQNSVTNIVSMKFNKSLV